MSNVTITLTDPKAGDYFYQEAMKTLRTNIQFSGKQNKAIMVTSAYSGEGKSDISFHLATEMGKAGKRVLLIDADIRKSAYVTRYEIPEKTMGLSQYLSGQVEQLDEVVYPTNYQNLHIILAGPSAPNPTEMLGDQHFGKLIRAARAVYDYVFVDTPPLRDVIDAAVVGQFCDGAVMVLESGAVSYRIARNVKSQLEKSGCKWLGAVLNKVDLKSDHYYGARYGRYSKYGRYGRYGKYGAYGYGYGYYRRKEEDGEEEKGNDA